MGNKYKEWKLKKQASIYFSTVKYRAGRVRCPITDSKHTFRQLDRPTQRVNESKVSRNPGCARHDDVCIVVFLK